MFECISCTFSLLVSNVDKLTFVKYNMMLHKVKVQKNFKKSIVDINKDIVLDEDDIQEELDEIQIASIESDIEIDDQDFE
jgi:hypothetical protein